MRCVLTDTTCVCPPWRQAFYDAALRDPHARSVAAALVLAARGALPAAERAVENVSAGRTRYGEAAVSFGSVAAGSTVARGEVCVVDVAVLPGGSTGFVLTGTRVVSLAGNAPAAAL